jgi:hypothetical protein
MVGACTCQRRPSMESVASARCRSPAATSPAARSPAGHFYGNGLEFGGGSAVQLFLVMAGALMAIAYADRVHTPGFDVEFWARRLARIAPLYHLSLLPFIPLVLARPVPLDWNLFAPVIGVGASVVLGFVTSALFVQTWLFHSVMEQRSINSPLWTICALALGYAAFPSLARRLVAPRSCAQMVCALAWLMALYLVLTFAALFGFHQLATWAVPYCERQPLCEWRLCDQHGCASPHGPIIFTYLAMHQSHWNKLPIFAMGVVVGMRARAFAPLPSSSVDARQSSADARQPSPDVRLPPPSSDTPPAHHRHSDEIWCNVCSLAVLTTQLVPIALSVAVLSGGPLTDERGRAFLISR